MKAQMVLNTTIDQQETQNSYPNNGYSQLHLTAAEIESFYRAHIVRFTGPSTLILLNSCSCIRREILNVAVIPLIHTRI